MIVVGFGMSDDSDDYMSEDFLKLTQNVKPGTSTCYSHCLLVKVIEVDVNQSFRRMTLAF